MNGQSHQIPNGTHQFPEMRERRDNLMKEEQNGKIGPRTECMHSTGNGEKLSNSQACCLAQLCLAAD